MNRVEEVVSSMPVTQTWGALFAGALAMGLSSVHNPVAYPWGIFSATPGRRILIWLYGLGKFMLVDICALVLMTMAAHRVHIEQQNFMVDLFVTPVRRFYAFLAAVSLTFAIVYICLSTRAQTRPRKQFLDGGRKESLSHHSFGTGSDNRNWKLSSSFHCFIFASILLCALLPFFSMLEKCFVFKTTVRAGNVLGDTVVSRYSYMSLGQAIPSLTEYPDSLLIQVYQVLFYCFGVIMPLICFIAVVILFVWPLTGKRQQQLLIVAELSSAWSALEMFMITSWLAMRHVTSGISLISCEVINNALGFDTQSEAGGDGNGCIEVQAAFGENAPYWLLGTVLYSVLTFVLIRVAHQAIEERLENEGVNVIATSIDGNKEDVTFVESLDNVFGGLLELDVDTPLNNRDIDDIHAMVAVPLLD